MRTCLDRDWEHHIPPKFKTIDRGLVPGSTISITALLIGFSREDQGDDASSSHVGAMQHPSFAWPVLECVFWKMHEFGLWISFLHYSRQLLAWLVLIA